MAPARRYGRGVSLGTVIQAVWRMSIFTPVGKDWTLSGYMGVFYAKIANFNFVLGGVLG